MSDVSADMHVRIRSSFPWLAIVWLGLHFPLSEVDSVPEHGCAGDGVTSTCCGAMKDSALYASSQLTLVVARVHSWPLLRILQPYVLRCSLRLSFRSLSRSSASIHCLKSYKPQTFIGLGLFLFGGMRTNSPCPRHLTDSSTIPGRRRATQLTIFHPACFTRCLPASCLQDGLPHVLTVGCNLSLDRSNTASTDRTGDPHVLEA